MISTVILSPENSFKVGRAQCKRPLTVIAIKLVYSEEANRGQGFQIYGKMLPPPRYA